MVGRRTKVGFIHVIHEAHILYFMHHHLLIWRWRDKTARLDDKEGTDGEMARKTDAEVADRMKLSVAGPEFQLSNDRLGLSVF